MKLFLDSSVILAARGRATGSSYFIAANARQFRWVTFANPYVVAEVEANVHRLGAAAVNTWQTLRQQIAFVPNVFSIPWPTVFPVSKDRPVLFSAITYTDVLLTFDRNDFIDRLEQSFYNLAIRTPSDFLIGERTARRV